MQPHCHHNYHADGEQAVGGFHSPNQRRQMAAVPVVKCSIEVDDALFTTDRLGDRLPAPRHRTNGFSFAKSLR